MTEILKALPTRVAGDNAIAQLYRRSLGDGNCKDYTQPEDLKKAFDKAKSRNWKLTKVGADGNVIDI